MTMPFTLIKNNIAYDTNAYDTGLFVVKMAGGQPFNMEHMASLCVWLVPGTWVD